MNSPLSKWVRWLDVLKTEIQELVVAKYIFHEVQGMIAANPNIQSRNSFYGYFNGTYISHMVSGLRRQIKTDPQSISLALLLKELAEAPETLTRTYYVSLYEGSGVEYLADKDFDRFALPGSPHIDATQVASDLRRLRDVSAKCEEFADKRVAHRDKRELKALPTYNELDTCIDILNELFVKYQSMLHGKSMATLLPTWQYDWKDIFRVPWIISTRGEQ